MSYPEAWNPEDNDRVTVECPCLNVADTYPDMPAFVVPETDTDKHTGE